MDTPFGAKSGAGLVDYLAEERTFLAWIRTGIALMGFGFLVAHFGLFAYGPGMQAVPGVLPHGFSLWIGAGLVAIGVVVNLLSARRYVRIVGELNRGRLVQLSLSKEAVIVALLLAGLGTAMTIYLTLALA